IIRLNDANAPFAPVIENTFSGMTFPKSVGRVQTPAKEKNPKDSDTEGQEKEDAQDILEPSDAKPPAADSPTDQLPARNCFTFQASTEHLTSVSPVFQIMLTGPWKESRILSERGSVEVTAKEWDSRAFLIVLRLMHGQHREVPRKVDLEMLAKVAVVADYYDCKQVLNPVAGLWISNLEKVPKTYCRDLILWVWISWFFQLPSEFQRATATVISMSEDIIDGLDLPIPGLLIRIMNRDRLDLIDILITLLDATCTDVWRDGEGHSFECRSMMSRALSKHMFSNGLRSPRPIHPFPGLSYQSLRAMMAKLQSPEWSQACFFKKDYEASAGETSTGCIPASTASHRCPSEKSYSFFPGQSFSARGYSLSRFKGRSHL
ncbi:hypothetical protein N7466_006427, partial [Penicillium verhagenii]|uniref:uncharacterized protein n=1 Tax=Penicillium verhagenii TaxID=1562060 RepID=UPI00254532DD